MVFQNPEDQLVKMRVEDEVAFGPENLGLPHDEIRSRVNEALKLLNISDLRARSPHELSSGQQQKVAISSILAMNPEILILDEPTSQLDPLSAVEIINFVKKLNVERGITVIIAEHRLENVARFADRMVVLNNGKIFSIGPPRKIMSDERLPGIGVSLPKIVQLANSLKEKGIHLETLPLTINEAVEFFRRIIR
jgi:energy-coupling factor transporter ATP-binding protein EcfA2